MIKIRYIFPVIIIILAACEKVIDVDLNETNPGIVIEANIHDGKVPINLRISETGSYFETYKEEGISGAEIEINNELGTNLNFTDIGGGEYILEPFLPKYNQLYHLKINLKGEVYEASSFLSEPVRIDDLTSEYKEGRLFFDSGYTVTCVFTDPADINNYYRIKITLNGESLNGPDDYYVFEDEFFDGKQVDLAIRGQLFELDDTVSISLLTIDQPAYIYYSTLQNILGGASARSAAPANPVSNFSNGALGYFSAYSMDSGTIVIKE